MVRLPLATPMPPAVRIRRGPLTIGPPLIAPSPPHPRVRGPIPLRTGPVGQWDRTCQVSGLRRPRCPSCGACATSAGGAASGTADRRSRTGTYRLHRDGQSRDGPTDRNWLAHRANRANRLHDDRPAANRSDWRRKAAAAGCATAARPATTAGRTAATGPATTAGRTAAASSGATTRTRRATTTRRAAAAGSAATTRRATAARRASAAGRPRTAGWTRARWVDENWRLAAYRGVAANRARTSTAGADWSLAGDSNATRPAAALRGISENQGLRAGGARGPDWVPQGRRTRSTIVSHEWIRHDLPPFSIKDPAR